MGEMILCILEPLFDLLQEWILLQFCNILIWLWHNLQASITQVFF
jgi:hypothetical protein